MAIKINADTSSGLKLTSDTSGVIEFQTAGTTRAGVNSTGLTGNGSQLTGISSIPENLQKSFTLTSGKTVTAGKMVSIDSSGEVGSLPAVNTLGTYRATSNTVQYGGANSEADGAGGISWDGSRGISLSGSWNRHATHKNYVGSQTTRAVTVTGHAFSAGATTVNGSTTVTVPIINRIGDTSQDGYTSYKPTLGAWSVNCYPLANDRFILLSQSGSNDGAGNYSFDFAATVVVVDSSGNCTKGTTVYSTRSTNTQTPSSYAMPAHDTQRRLSNDTFIMNFGWGDTYNFGPEPTYNLRRVAKWTGGTTVTIHKSNYANDLKSIASSHVCPGSVRTSGNKIVWWQQDGLKTYMISIADSDGGLGNTASVTGVLMTAIPIVSPGVAFVGDQWYGSFRKPTDETKLWIQGYNYGGDNFRVMVGMTVSSAGVVTANVGTYSTGNTADDVNYPEYGTISFTNDSTLAMAGFRTLLGVTYVNTFSINSAGRITGSNLGNTINGNLADNRTAIRWTGSKWLIFTRESNSLTANQVTVDLTVGDQATESINFIGFPVATDSSTPTNIIVQGVADGFSSLTPGETYYENNLHDGTITLDNTSLVKVGKAISSTELLINRTL